MITVNGRCPACHSHGLFVTQGGHLTCSSDECPNPGALDRILTDGKVPDNLLVANMYWRLKRDPEEGTISPAIRVHSQACGLIAYLLDKDLDEIAEMIRSARPRAGRALR